MDFELAYYISRNYFLGFIYFFYIHIIDLFFYNSFKLIHMYDLYIPPIKASSLTSNMKYRTDCRFIKGGVVEFICIFIYMYVNMNMDELKKGENCKIIKRLHGEIISTC